MTVKGFRFGLEASHIDLHLFPTEHLWMKNGFNNLISIISLLCLIGALGYAAPLQNSLRECMEDRDCIIIDGSCCGCTAASAGSQLAINKKNQVKAKKDIQMKCDKQNVGCLMGVSNKDVEVCKGLRAVCIKKLCEVQ